MEDQSLNQDPRLQSANEGYAGPIPPMPLEHLAKIQNEMKIEASRENKFAGFKYSNGGDIASAAKPLLEKHKCTMTVTVSLVTFNGNDYAKATAYYVEPSKAWTAVTAYARLAWDKKKMDYAQMTGTAETYAAKYAMSYLFNVHHERDSDDLDNTTNGKQQLAENKLPKFTPESSRWPGAIKAIATGKTTVKNIVKNFDVSVDDLEILMYEQFQYQRSQEEKTPNQYNDDNTK